MIRLLISLLAILTLISCNTDMNKKSLKSSFESPFPKRAKNLIYKLSNEFSVKNGKDTTNYLVSFDKKNKINYIINRESNDTIFSGIVNKYKGLYYFNMQIDDSVYWIYAVEIKNNFIRGLGTHWQQMIYLNSEIDKIIYEKENKNNALSGLIKSINKDTSYIKLTPDKKIMKGYYKLLMKEFETDTIISNTISDDEITQIVDENYNDSVLSNEMINHDVILKLYPNPASEFIIIETKDFTKKMYKITTSSGRSVLSGVINQEKIKIDISEFPTGLYFVTVSNTIGDFESLKFIIE